MIELPYGPPGRRAMAPDARVRAGLFVLWLALFASTVVAMFAVCVEPVSNLKSPGFTGAVVAVTVIVS